MPAFAPGLKRSFTGNTVERADFFTLYRNILGGRIIGDLHDPNCHIDFSMPGIISPIHVEVKVEPDMLALANSFKIHLHASREKRMGFVFVCVGDPPSGPDEPCVKLFESFDAYGGWIGRDVREPLRSKLIQSFTVAHSLFPTGSFPEKPLLSAWREARVVA